MFLRPSSPHSFFSAGVGLSGAAGIIAGMALPPQARVREAESCTSAAVGMACIACAASSGTTRAPTHGRRWPRSSSSGIAPRSRPWPGGRAIGDAVRSRGPPGGDCRRPGLKGEGGWEIPWVCFGCVWRVALGKLIEGRPTGSEKWAQSPRGARPKFGPDRPRRARVFLLFSEI